MRKFSLRNLGRDVLWRRKSEQSAKVFSAKIVFSPICESFLPQKFSAIRYIILWEVDYMLNLVNSNLQYDPIQLRRVHVCNCMIVLALFPGLSQLFVTELWCAVHRGVAKPRHTPARAQATGCPCMISCWNSDNYIVAHYLLQSCMDTICHLLTFFLCICILYSGPHLDSSIVCWPWIQILLSRGRNKLVSNLYINYYR